MGYIHSRTLHWSFGVMRGSDAEHWFRRTAQLPPAELVPALAAAGFGAIYLDRYAYPDRAASLEAELAKLLNTPVLESGNKRFAFWSMVEYNKASLFNGRYQRLK
jgi:phosphoglycerol transferase